MKKNLLHLFCVLLVSASVAGTACVAGKQGHLTAELVASVVYRCENGDEVFARYYSLSDGSLSFVKLLMADRAEFTLPNVLSGSGVRYTDEVELVWWSKGDGALAERRDQDGQWQSLYQDCQTIN